MKRRTVSTPKTKPPTCAKNATPPPACGLHEREPALPELEAEPEAEEEEGRDLDEEVQEQRQHARGRQEDEVGAENAGDRAARPEVRDGRVGIRARPEGDDGLSRGRGDPGQQVEAEEADRPHRVLDVVAEDPEEEHVPDDVQPASVHEHRGQPRDVPVVADGGPGRAGADDLARLVGVLDDRAVEIGQLVEDPDREVDRDQRDRDDGERPRRDVVLDREHLLDDQREQRLLGMQAILRLVPDRRLRPVEHVLGDLLAVVGGEAMQDDRVRARV